MSASLYYEDIVAGQDLPLQIQEPVTTRSIVMWAAAVRDFFEIHYDKDFAVASGMPAVLSHGPYKCCLMSRLMLEWIGETGRLHKLFCMHKASSFPGDTLIIKGKVKSKYIKDDQNYVECELWVEDQNGKITAPGSALVSLPSKTTA